MIIHNPILTGSFSVNGADLSTITGSVATSASFDARTTYLESTSSILTAASASQSVTSGSLVAASASLSATSGSLSAASGSFNTRVSALEATGSALSSSLLTVSGSGYATSASLSAASGSFNSRVATIESKYATTGSNTFIGTQVVSGSILQSGSFTSTGTLTAQTLVIQTITSSVVYSSGSNVFGNSLGNSQVFTGSVLITGSLTIAGASSATSYSGTTIYGSTAVCSAVGFFSGCVGIGTVSPGTRLEVVATGENVLKLKNSGGQPSLVRFNDTSTTLDPYIGSYGNDLAFGTYGGGEKMRITSGGNLGLGVTPSAWSGFKAIQVNNASLSGWSSDNTAMFLGANNYFDGTNFRYISSNFANQYRQQAGDHYWFNAPSGTAGAAITFTQAMTLTAAGYLSVSGNVATNNPPSYQGLSFGWNKSNGYGESLITYTNIGGGSMPRLDFGYWNGTTYSIQTTIFNSGNVLIGSSVTDAGYKLDVNGTGRFTSNLLAQKVQVGTAATINDATGVGNTLQFANYSAGVFVTGSADSYIYKTSGVFGGLSAQTLIFQTRSDVAGGGFAFVAGSTPSAIATISNTGAATFSSSVTANQMFSTTTAAGYAAILTNTNGASDSNGLLVKAGSISSEYNVRFANQTDTTTFFTIKGNGNVGIGISSPSSVLDVQSVASVLKLKSTTGTNSVYTNYENCSNFYVGTDSTSGASFGKACAGILWQVSCNSIVFATSNTEQMRITGGGNVGIGTTGPQARLQVSCTANFGAILKISDTTTESTGIIALGDGNTSVVNVGIWRAAANCMSSYGNWLNLGGYDGILFATCAAGIGSQAERMRITSGGSVSIGSASAAYNFNVYGASGADGWGAFFGGGGATKGGIYIGNAGNQYGTLYFDNGNNNVYLKQSYVTGCVIVIANTGGVYLANGGTSWAAISSDIRKKKNFETTQGLAEVLQIEPIKYHFNEDDNNSTKRLGFKAQNIKPLIPEMVLETGEFAEDGSPYLTVTPDYILPVLVKAIQELNTKFEEYKTTHP